MLGNYLFSSEAVWRGLARPKLMCKNKNPQNVLLNTYVCQLGVAPKTRKHFLCYVFLKQIIDGNCIFSHSLAKLANMVQYQQVDKHTPPSRGGLALAAMVLTRCADLRVGVW